MLLSMLRQTPLLVPSNIEKYTHAVQVMSRFGFEVRISFENRLRKTIN